MLSVAMLVLVSRKELGGGGGVIDGGLSVGCVGAGVIVGGFVSCVDGDRTPEGCGMDGDRTLEGCGMVVSGMPLEEEMQRSLTLMDAMEYDRGQVVWLPLHLQAKGGWDPAKGYGSAARFADRDIPWKMLRRETVYGRTGFGLSYAALESASEHQVFEHAIGAGSEDMVMCVGSAVSLYGLFAPETWKVVSERKNFDAPANNSLCSVRAAHGDIYCSECWECWDVYGASGAEVG